MGLNAVSVALVVLFGAATCFTAWSVSCARPSVSMQRGSVSARAIAASGMARWRAASADAAATSALLSNNSLYRREIEAWAAYASTQPADTLLNRMIRPVLERVANSQGEVMIAIANDVMTCLNPKTCWWGGGNILASFIMVNKRIGITNYLIIALDDTVSNWCEKEGAPYIRVDLEVPDAQKGSRGANMISTLKYDLLADVMLMGYAILVVDLDLVFLRNPFDHLHRDSDLEGSSDGFTKGWAGGQISSVSDKSMGWGGGGLYTQLFTINVGCVFVQPSPRTVALARRVAAALKAKPAWDQQVFNEILLMPGYAERPTHGVSLRVMDHMLWVNSKTFFKSERRHFFPGASATAKMPVMVHMNCELCPRAPRPSFLSLSLPCLRAHQPRPFAGSPLYRPSRQAQAHAVCDRSLS